VDTAPGTAEVQTVPLYFGAEANIRPLIGTLDELRVSAQARSSNWVWATWMNVASNASFATVGAVTNLAVPGYAGYAAQIPDAGQRNAGDDPDGDGFPNLLEYATGGSPTNVDESARLATRPAAGGFALSFSRNTNATEATILVEGSSAVTNEAAWTGIATNTGGTWGGDTNVTESGTGTPVNVSVRSAGETNRFLRLRVWTP
jgi:hypothetical protein